VVLQVEQHWADPNGQCKSYKIIMRFLNVVFGDSVYILMGPYHEILGISGNRILKGDPGARNQG